MSVRTLYGRLDLCAINTATLGHKEPIGSVIDAVARHGYGAICPWRRDLVGEDVAKIARHIRDAGLKVSGYCRSTYLPALHEADFAGNIADNLKAIEETALLDAACFVLVVGSLPEGSKNLDRARDQVAEGIATMLAFAKTCGVRLALEPLHPMYANDRACVNTLEQALDLAALLEPDASEHPSLGVAVDVYHVWWDPKLESQINRAGAANRLFGFHVCDWLTPTRDFLTDRGMMGDGVIDIPKIRRMVESAGYDGPVEVEIFSHLNWWQRPIDETLRICAERLESVC